MCKKLPHLLSAGIAVSLMGGCSFIPEYERPESPVPGTYPGSGTLSEHVSPVSWRQFFLDSRLRQYIADSLDNNRDLQIAALKVEQAQAQYRIEKSALLPSVNGSGAFTRERANNSTGNRYNASVNLTSYEVDLFGKIRSSAQAALEDYFALEETRRSTQIALIAQVAVQYFAYLEYAEQLDLSRKTLDTVQNYADMTKRKVQFGKDPESDLAMMDVQIETARASVHAYSRLMTQAAHALEELTSKPIAGEKTASRSLERRYLVADIPAGLPSNLITRRPDILAAEHALRAANANIGAARAAFFPSITLTGSMGGESSELSRLFDKPGRAWSFSPQVSLPIFTGGRNKASLDASRIGKRIEIANYEKTIQTAFREVSDALVARREYRKQLEAQQALVAAQQRRLEFSQIKYNNGITGYLDVLTAQQDLFSAQQDLISIRSAQLQNLVMLYKALGGGCE